MPNSDNRLPLLVTLYGQAKASNEIVQLSQGVVYVDVARDADGTLHITAKIPARRKKAVVKRRASPKGRRFQKDRPRTKETKAAIKALPLAFFDRLQLDCVNLSDFFGKGKDPGETP